METMTITFVLGALSGLFLLGMVYAFIGVLKIQKQIKSIQGDIRHLNKQMNTMDHEIHRRISTIEEQAHRRMDEMLRDLELQRQDEVRRSNEDYSNLRKQLDDTNRYIDKRVDNTTTTAVQYVDSKIENTVDALCARMDILLNDGLKAFHGIKEEELLKS